MGTVNLPLGAGNSGTNDWSDVYNNDSALADQVNGNLEAVNLKTDAVTTAKITDANVTDAKLASPNNSVYKTLLNASVLLPADAASTLRLPLGVHGLDGIVGTTAFTINATSGTLAQDLGCAGVYIDDADYEVGSLTEKLQIRAQVLANATAPGITFTVSLYPVTVQGVPNGLQFDWGTVVPDSGVVLTTPSASTITPAKTSADFAFPADGFYILGVGLSGNLTNDSAVQVSAQLQTRNVA